MDHSELLAKIESFDIDGGPVSLTFPKRLARENGWSVAYAQRVIDEYKRFVFLAMTAGHPVTPSDQVDQAWHLHLTYSDSYWERLNGEVLPKPLKHNPTKGGQAENEKFDDWYNRTLASYERIFGAAPPPDIWPCSDIRFGEHLHFRRVNTAQNLIIPRTSLSKAKWVGLTVVVAAVASGCVAQTTTDTVFMVMIGLGVLIPIVLAVVIVNAIKNDPRKRDAGSGCSSGSSGCGSDNRHDGDSDSGADSGCSSGCGGGGCGGGGD
ncbi:MAG: hypothetical protein K1X67_24945 [Fimbriimonadaceae bacterium]|nr:hypothetical protein [Fimbriimonadaceae bacterium]